MKMSTNLRYGCIVWAQAHKVGVYGQCERTFEGGVCLSLMSRYLEHRAETKAALFFGTIGDGMLVAKGLCGFFFERRGHYLPLYELYSAEREIWN